MNTFHRRNLIRQEVWSNGMNATSTHDTKRGEDVRARINVLSEMPEEWYRAIRRWREMNSQWKTKVGDLLLPGPNEEYLLYQSLVGTWPLLGMNAKQHSEYVGRIQTYMKKAVREAKIHSSWINPKVEYEQCLERFVAAVLSRAAENAFLKDFRQFHAPISRAGIWNSLSQMLLKVACPGVPDFYQGNELWCFDLVDPDNRRPVNFELRRSMLSRLRMTPDCLSADLVDKLVASPCDGAIKLYLTSRALGFRREHRELFSKGSYIPLLATGALANHVVAFARALAGKNVITLAARFFIKLCNSHRSPASEVWTSTIVRLPAKIGQQCFRDVFTGQIIEVAQRDGEAAILLAAAFSHCPVALLVGLDATQSAN
jgi:(1->4)-alpha-D-glucan 1-alpha-D-glucosylmutase